MAVTIRARSGKWWLFAVAAAGMVAASPASAIVKCRTADGKLIFADSPPPGCVVEGDYKAERVKPVAEGYTAPPADSGPGIVEERRRAREEKKLEEAKRKRETEEQEAAERAARDERDALTSQPCGRNGDCGPGGRCVKVMGASRGVCRGGTAAAANRIVEDVLNGRPTEESITILDGARPGPRREPLGPSIPTGRRR